MANQSSIYSTACYPNPLTSKMRNPVSSWMFSRQTPHRKQLWLLVFYWICEATKSRFLIKPKRIPVQVLSMLLQFLQVSDRSQYKISPGLCSTRVYVLIRSKTTALPWWPYQSNHCHSQALFSITVGTDAVTWAPVSSDLTHKDTLQYKHTHSLSYYYGSYLPLQEEVWSSRHLTVNRLLLLWSRSVHL